MIKTKKLLTLLLSGAMVFSLFPTNVFATEEHINSSSITQFSQLSTDVITQEFIVGDTAAPTLPEALSATQTDITWEEVDGVWSSETVDTETNVDVGWLLEDDKTFSTENADTFTYTATASDYLISSDVEMPQIEIVVKYAITSASQKTLRAGAITGEGYSFENGVLSISTNAGTTGWRSNTSIDKTAVTSVEIGDTVTSIERDAFLDCTALATVTISTNSKLHTIGGYAFGNCSALTAITIPDTVTSIGGAAFTRCHALETITFSETSTLHTIGGDAFNECRALTTIAIPDTVTSLSDYLFDSCTALTTITISANSKIKTIGHYTFKRCTALTTMIIPDTVTSLGNNSFWDCTALTTITIPDTVTSIGYGAFLGCDELKSVYFDGNYPTTDRGILTIRDAANIYYNPTATGWDSMARAKSFAITVDSPEFYTGNPPIVTVLINGASSTDFTTEGLSAQAGEHAVTISGINSETFVVEKNYTISRSGTVFDGGIKTYKGDTETTTFNYGDTITAKVTPKATGEVPITTFSLVAPEKNQMALYLANEQISTPVSADDNGMYTMTYDTTTEHLTVGGQNVITAKYVGNANMVDFNADVTITLNKANSSITTAPTARTDLKYTGSPQALVSAGTAANGEMQYSFTEDSGYSTIIPTGTSAGTYTVYYKVVGDANHNDTVAASVNVTIETVDATVSANDKSAFLGDTKPTFTFTQTGFVNGETISGVTFTENVDMNTASPYSLIPSGGTVSGGGNRNYEITYIAGTLYVTVDTAALKIAIETANTAKDGIIVNDSAPSSVASGTKFVSQIVMTKFNNAILAAETVANTATTNVQVTDAISALETAKTAFTNAIQTGTYRPSAGGGGGSSSSGNPEIKTGKNQTIKQGQAITFVSDEKFSNYKHTEVDNERVDEKYLTVEDGSTKVTLSSEFTDTLSVGEHTLEIVSTTGTAKTTFTVTAKGEHTNPQTGVRFNDVKSSDWFYDFVYDVVANVVIITAKTENTLVPQGT